MTPSRAAAERASVLRSLHCSLNSWRKVQEQHYPSVHFAALNRIANTGGEWLPSARTRKGREQLRALGLVERRPLTPVQKAIRKMARATNDAVVRRKKEG